MDIIKFFYGFQFYKYSLLNQYICDKFTDNLIII